MVATLTSILDDCGLVTYMDGSIMNRVTEKVRRRKKTHDKIMIMVFLCWKSLKEKELQSEASNEIIVIVQTWLRILHTLETSFQHNIFFLIKINISKEAIWCSIIQIIWNSPGKNVMPNKLIVETKLMND